jgi:hypothetical protein
MDATPRSFVSLLERACWGWGWGINEKVKRFEKQSLTLVLKCVGSWSCVPISADEAIGEKGRRKVNNKKLVRRGESIPPPPGRP